MWLTERATDYLRGDIAVKGGLSTMLKTAHLAEAFHMNYEVHHGGNSLNNLAQLHFASAIRNTTYFEVLLPHGAHNTRCSRTSRSVGMALLVARRCRASALKSISISSNASRRRT